MNTPPAICKNTITKGVYTFDVNIINLGLPGFQNVFTLSNVDVLAKGIKKLFFGVEFNNGEIARHYSLGNIDSVWVENSTIKGKVDIHPAFYDIFDTIAEYTRGELLISAIALGDRHLPNDNAECDLPIFNITTLLGATVLYWDGRAVEYNSDIMTGVNVFRSTMPSHPLKVNNAGLSGVTGCAASAALLGDIKQ